jgi:hypothetical protein
VNHLNRFFCGSLALCFLLSCSSGSNKTSGNPVARKGIEKGKVIASIPCLKNPSVTYALYLPSNYAAGKTCPVILAFDPSAKGSLPVEKYKELAEKYGYIMMGSNNSKNGLAQNETSDIVYSLFSEMNDQYSVDTSRIYAMGFSGGARVACMIALYRGGVAGVIGSGAGFPAMTQPGRYRFDYIGLAGKADFNMFELLRLDGQLEQSGFRHALVLFDGRHAWPPENIMEQAFEWNDFCAMKSGLMPKNDALVQGFIGAREKVISSEVREGKVLNACDDLKNMIHFVDGLVGTDSYRKELADLENTGPVKKAQRDRETRMQEELQLQQFYTDNFLEKDPGWWDGEISKYETRIRKGKNTEDTIAARRMLSYLSLLSYMVSNRAVTSGDTASARQALAIYKRVDPENSEVYYLFAVLDMKEDRPGPALASLKTAVAKGFSDKPRLQNQPEFQSLKADRAYFDLEQSIK